MYWRAVARSAISRRPESQVDSVLDHGLNFTVHAVRQGGGGARVGHQKRRGPQFSRGKAIEQMRRRSTGADEGSDPAVLKIGEAGRIGDAAVQQANDDRSADVKNQRGFLRRDGSRLMNDVDLVFLHEPADDSAGA